VVSKLIDVSLGAMDRLTVIVDGDAITASTGENADVFWASRRDGGNFGVVASCVNGFRTSLEARAVAMHTSIASVSSRTGSIRQTSCASTTNIPSPSEAE
jgi:hypothetical protein